MVLDVLEELLECNLLDILPDIPEEHSHIPVVDILAVDIPVVDMVVAVEEAHNPVDIPVVGILAVDIPVVGSLAVGAVSVEVGVAEVFPAEDKVFAFGDSYFVDEAVFFVLAVLFDPCLAKIQILES